MWTRRALKSPETLKVFKTFRVSIIVRLVYKSAKLALLALILMLSGCGKEPVLLTDFFPDMSGSPDWTPAGEAEVYDRENIYDLVNGQAESFFAYGFEQVAVQRYENDAGVNLDVEVWQLATPADAYGLFTASIAGAPTDVGPSTGSGHRNNGDADPGRRLSFWQDRYLVQVRARSELNDAALRGFAQAIAMALPVGGETPALVKRLPPDGLVERSAVFFHEEISIQNKLWLGGENVLGLSPETDGVLAQYDLGGETPVWLLLVQYPDADSAAAGISALEAGSVDMLVSVGLSQSDGAQDNLLGAVFGAIPESMADQLLAEALQ